MRFMQINDKSEDPAQCLPLSRCSMNMFSFPWVNGENFKKEAKLTTSVPSGKILVDGLGVGDVGNIVLRDRQHLSQD